MTDHSATPVHYPPKTANTHPCVLQPITIPTGSTLGSILGCMVATSAAKSVDPLDWYKNFTPSLYSTAHLQRVHILLVQRDLKVIQLEQSLATIHETSRAEQDRITQRNPSRHVAKRPPSGFGFPNFHESLLATIGPYTIIQPVNAAGEVWITDRTIAAVYKLNLGVRSRLRSLARTTQGRYTREQYLEWEEKQQLKYLLEERTDSWRDLHDGKIVTVVCRSWGEVLPDGKIVRHREKSYV